MSGLRLTRRLRRTRRTPALRGLVREARLAADQFILPLFVCEGDPVMVFTPPGGGGAADGSKKCRAFDKASGAVLWETTFPAGANGTLMTYMHNGKQYIVTPIGSKTHAGEWLALSLP